MLGVATHKGLFLVDDQGTVESTAFLGDPVSQLCFDANSALAFAALDHGHFGVKLHRSQDHGKTWTEIAAPKYPEKPAEATADKNPWTLQMIWSLALAPLAEQPRLWCGTIPGGLFHSDDLGDTWHLNEALWNMPERQQWFGGGKDQPGIHSICIDPRNPEHIIVGVSCGGIWRSTDNGASWQAWATGLRADYLPPEQAYDVNVQDPHCVVQCQDEPDKLWCQHHNGMFKSVDGGAQWTEMTEVQPSVFGFACAVDPHNGNRAWFVPAIKDEHRIPVNAAVVVNRTDDGGGHFQTLREGLPQAHAYDLVYRHALCIDPSGQRLAFGSTTGNLWFSDNGGDAWQLLHSHLPPILAVHYIDS